MTKRKKTIGRIILQCTLLSLAVLILVFFVAGRFAAVAYNGSVSRSVAAPVAQVWALLNDTKQFNANRHEVRSTELLPNDSLGMRRWREHTMLAGDMHFTVVSRQEPNTLLIAMTESGFGMHGTWKFSLVPDGASTRITITEQSYTEGLVMRSILNTLGRNANLLLLQRALEKGVKLQKNTN